MESEKAVVMCNLSKGVEERGIAIGLERGIETTTLNAIRNLMETLKLTAEQAMEALKVPKEEKAKLCRDVERIDFAECYLYL